MGVHPGGGGWNCDYWLGPEPQPGDQQVLEGLLGQNPSEIPARAYVPGDVTSNDCIVSNESFEVWGNPGQDVLVSVYWGDESGSTVEAVQLDGNGYGIFYLSHRYTPWEPAGFPYTQTIDVQDMNEMALLSESQYTIHHG